MVHLAYKRYGTGRPLIILHGLLGAGGNWHTLSNKAFGPHFEVFAVDQRNHGRSPHSEVFDYPAMVDDLAAFMHEHHLASTHLLGHSMGGKTAIHFALTHPERVEALIVVDMAPRAYPPRHRDIFDALRALDLRAYPSRRAIDAALAERIPSYPVRQLLLKNLAYDGENGYTWRINLDAIYRNYDRVNTALEPGRSFDGPTLFIRGGDSDYVTDADVPLLTAWFPKAEVVTIAGAGHWVHADQPQAFAETVLAFLGT
ncbi:MAG: alpha/beta fold hydrolase [Rhodothermales bacterium]